MEPVELESEDPNIHERDQPVELEFPEDKNLAELALYQGCSVNIKRLHDTRTA